ncbi:MAG: hypothetical protein JHC81_04825 [Brevundimonas sp.]|uniref:hypothetical protein n=1 Tax=Brevundimonas sp. TaxID=1871086 RepID=UPI001A1EB51F|nr:hypothetical protein [Brevundimonas sp.]MBJ7446838.1 hypothetical protein [Brevundimonas sp.]
MTEIAHFIERGKDEPLAMHLHRNADVLGASRDQRARLRRAAALTGGGTEDRIEAGLIAASVRDELKVAIDEVIYAAQARGEAVSDYNTDGAKRIKGRDGLWSLADSGGLSEAQFNTGLMYRGLYERVMVGGIGSQMSSVGELRATKASTAGQIGQGLHRAYAGVRLTAAETSVRCAEKVALLRAVAGEGRTIGSLSSSGHRRKVLITSLGIALDVVRISLGQTGGLRITGS